MLGSSCSATYRRFLQLGYAVLLSDVDIVFLQNPFHHLVRDCDVESMSDGWDNATAYGDGALLCSLSNTLWSFPPGPAWRCVCV